MSPETELRIIRKHSYSRLTIGSALALLNECTNIIFRRQILTTDLAIEHELRMIEIRKCLSLLKELS